MTVQTALPNIGSSKQRLWPRVRVCADRQSRPQPRVNRLFRFLVRARITRLTPPLQSFCNPNARSAIAFVGTPWESGPKVSLQMATVLVTSCDQTHLSGPISAGSRGALSRR